jgi:HNH endonuclease
MITAIELRERLSYDPNTGDWIWLQSPRFGWVGRPAGSLDAKGYLVIKIDGKSYKASRLAYLYMTGEWPEEEMDHINRTSWDDRWINLRPATRTENNQNRVKIGESGHAGIYRHSQNDRWCAQVENIYIGSYETIDEAVAARDAFINERKAS